MAFQRGEHDFDGVYTPLIPCGPRLGVYVIWSRIGENWGSEL
jgi:hypothetical protein